MHVGIWFGKRPEPAMVPLGKLRIMIRPGRIRIPDVVVCEAPIPEEEFFTTPPYLCIEVRCPDDTVAGLQDRLDDYLQFGVPNIWVIDPWRHRGWRISRDGWATANDGVMRTADGRVAMPLADVLLP